MAIDFPNSPSVNDSFTVGNRTWIWDGTTWELLTTASDPIQKTIVEAKGDLIVGTADDTVSRLAVGTNEHRLVADSGESTGLKYVADTTNYAIGAKGDLLVGTAADTVSNLAVGTDGYILTADSGETTGLKWIQLAAGTPTSASAFVSTEETTTSTSYTDLATSGPAVTLTTGTKALVIIKARIFANTTGQSAYMSTAISGASSVSAADEYSLAQMSADTQNPRLNVASAHVYTGLTAGSNTFTAKYKTTNASSAAYFRWREIIVIDLGS